MQGEYTWTVKPGSFEQVELLFRARATDAAGNETKMEQISPGAAPAAPARNELTVVATGPHRSDSRLIEVTYNVRWIKAGAQLQRVDVWLSPDGGASWKGAYGPDDPEAPIPSTIQARVNRDGTYGIIVRARDSLGNQEPPIKADATPEFSVLVDTAPPRLEVNSSPSLETPLDPGTPVLLSWKAQDANFTLKPVHIEISEDGGQTWKDFDRNAPPLGNREWNSSSQERTYVKFRLTATDLAGKTAQRIIPAQAPSVEVTRLEQSSDGRLSVGYRVRNLSAPHRLQRVEIFTRMSGTPPRRWTPSGQYKTGTEGTFHLDLPPAAYDLLIRLILEGDIQNSPDPRTKTTASYQLGGSGSELELLSLNGGPNQVYQGGSTETVRWRLRSSLSPTVLRLSYRVSESGEWIPITQLDSDTDSYEWTLPLLTTNSVRVRLEWEGPNGKKAWATSRNPFAIDSAPPQVESVEGPVFYSHGTAQPIRLTIRFRDIGDAGLAQGTLWERPVGKTRWQRMDDPNQKVASDGIWTFELRLKPTPARAHEFFVTGVDRAGNAMTPPTPDSPPQHTMTIDSIKPELQFSTNPSGENPIREGEVLQLEWLASDENLAEKPVQIHYLGKNRNWRPIATDLEAQGSMTWIVPATLAGSPVRIRASARDQASNVTLVNWGTSASVTQRPPGPRVEMPTALGLDVRAMGPFESAHRTIKLDISTQGLEPGTSLTKVNVYWTKDGGLRWEGPAAISRILSPNQIETQLPTDGRLGLTLRGITSDGTAESRPRSPNPPELVILVDSTPPEIQLTDLDEDVFWNRPIYPIRWQPAADENLSDRPIRLYFRLQGENSWKAIGGDLPNRGSHAWRIPAGFMGPAQFKIVARDRLGNQSEQTSPGRFYFESIRPTLRVIAPKGLVNRGGQEIIFELLNRKLELEKVDIYRSIDGGTTWQPALGAYTTRGNLHALGNRKYRLAYEGIEGENCVYLVAHDRAGNHNPLPTPGTLPQLTFVLDQIPPRVMIQDSMGGKAFRPGHSLDLEWNATDPNLPEPSIKIALSDSSGRTWETTIGDNLPNSGQHPLSLPQKNGEHYRIRIQATDRAGNTGTAMSGEFIIDGLPPTSQALPPENWTEPNAIPIQVTARDAGGAGVQAVQLWFKHEEIEGGKWQLLLPWTPHPLNNPIPLSGPDGNYKIVSRSRDRAGNLENKSGFEESGPTPEATADASLTLSRTGPQVRFIKTFAQSGLVGGGTHSIHWETNWNQLGQIAPITQVQIKFSTDGGQNWELIAGAEALPDTPPFAWTPPPSIMKESCHLQILVQNEFGQKNSSTSAAFRLDTVPPKTTIRFQDEEDNQVRGWIEPSLKLDLEMLPLMESLPRLPRALFHVFFFSASETMKKATNAFFDGRYPEAIRLIQSQLDSTPTPSFQLHYLLALSLRERDGDSREVEHHLKIASKLAGNDPKIANDLGCLYFRRGQFESSHQWFKKAIEASQSALFDKTTRARFFYNLGATYYHQKDPSGAIGAFNQCLSHAPIREAHVYLALAHARLGQTTQEIQHLRDIALLYPSDSSVSTWARNRLRVRPASAPKGLAR